MKNDIKTEVEWMLDNLSKNTLGKVKLEYGVGTVIDGHLFKLKLLYLLKLLNEVENVKNQK